MIDNTDICNIPIQAFCMTDRDGRMTPLWFRLEVDHKIQSYHIEQIVSRDEKNYVGIKEKQFVCTFHDESVKKTIEIRYSVDTQKWRIFQFL